MMKRLLKIKRRKPRNFQVLFLKNDSSQDVEAQDFEQVDFLAVQQHLEQGESVFITSKRSQKITTPKLERSAACPNPKTRIVTAFQLDPV